MSQYSSGYPSHAMEEEEEEVKPKQVFHLNC